MSLFTKEIYKEEDSAVSILSGRVSETSKEMFTSADNSEWTNYKATIKIKDQTLVVNNDENKLDAGDFVKIIIWKEEE